jgi:hypothetical protein
MKISSVLQGVWTHCSSREYAIQRGRNLSRCRMLMFLSLRSFVISLVTDFFLKFNERNRFISCSSSVLVDIYNWLHCLIFSKYWIVMLIVRCCDQPGS